MKNKFIIVATLAIGFASCEPEFENEVNAAYSSGEADFTTYVAVGNSLTAGYMDGTVSRVGQTYSYPNLLAQQFALVGGGAFTQPSFEDDTYNRGGILGVPGFGNRLVIDASQNRPEPIAGASTITLTPQAKAFNNMGVPGAKSFHLLAAGYGNVANLPNANPYFIRHASTPNATVLADAMSKNPTFFTNWIGSNDVLAYATAGGAQADGVTPAADHNVTGNLNPATYGFNDITNSGVFNNVYTNIINTLTVNGAKGVVCTIPSVTSIPYFTTVPVKALPAEATSGNATAIGLYQFLAAVSGGRISPLSTAAGTKNPVLIKDESLTDIGSTIQAAAASTPFAPYASVLGALYGQARHAKYNVNNPNDPTNDLIVLPASSIIGQPNPAGTAPFNVNGVTLPLANKWVLTSTEKAKVAAATAAYNNSIVAIAATKNLAVADMNAVMNQLVSGLQVETNSIYTANYFSGSGTEGQVLFSLDGVHPNARGYAVIANEIIKTINAKYKSNLPLHNPTYFPGINILPTN
ncbi:G-D-S-L family lipolytic protein [Flavobacterium sp.]|uniref:G-D-S-L family lipolytic protein n=1 Tax=Flavobacterium sp. TaxID=239 RepID=UPI001B40C73F|nr:G-D-S-L family lipolytic protein [Flavobacterium sp.]MBP6128114.1 G-D-S-L family lipolytic protein [Flavobacterium sp.]